MVRSETEADLMRVESLVTGSTSSDVISEMETPKHLVFEAGDGHDFHVRTQITIENPDDGAQTERITVSLSEGDTTHGRTLVSSSQTVTLGAGEVRTLDFNTETFRLSAQQYQVEVELGGDASVPFTVTATKEYTRPATYTWDITSRGDYELVSHTGEPSIRVDGEDGTVSFPSGHAISPAPLQVGEDRQEVFVEDDTSPGRAAVADSADTSRLTFQAGEGVDIHEQAVVHVANQTDSSQSDSLQIDLIERGTGGDTDTVLATETIGITLDSGGSMETTAVTEDLALSDGEHLLRAEMQDDLLTVTKLVEETRGVEYSWQTDGQRLTLTDLNDERFVEYPLQSGPVSFPAGIAPEATRYPTHRGDPSAADLADGEAMTFISDGSGTGSAGDLVYAINDGGSILTSVIAAKSNAT